MLYFVKKETSFLERRYVLRNTAFTSLQSSSMSLQQPSIGHAFPSPGRIASGDTCVREHFDRRRLNSSSICAQVKAPSTVCGI